MERWEAYCIADGLLADGVDEVDDELEEEDEEEGGDHLGVDGGGGGE